MIFDTFWLGLHLRHRRLYLRHGRFDRVQRPAHLLIRSKPAVADSRACRPVFAPLIAFSEFRFVMLEISSNDALLFPATPLVRRPFGKRLARPATCAAAALCLPARQQSPPSSPQRTGDERITRNAKNHGGERRDEPTHQHDGGGFVTG